MLAFIVPFRSKASSKNWALHSKLLHRTLSSICNQTSSAFKVFVVYTDLPLDHQQTEKVEFIYFPFPFLTYDKIADFENYGKKHYSKVNAQNAMDQSRRVMFGVLTAKKQGFSYIMSVDADDLISNKIAEFVENSGGNCAGWYIDKGYVYPEGRKYVYKQPSKMNYINGSTNIVRSDIIPTPDFENSTNLWDYNFFSAHAYLASRVKQYFQEELQPLPFYGIIYSINTGSWTYAEIQFFGKGLRKMIKFLLRGRLLSKALKKEFLLTNLK